MGTLEIVCRHHKPMPCPKTVSAIPSPNLRDNTQALPLIYFDMLLGTIKRLSSLFVSVPNHSQLSAVRT